MLRCERGDCFGRDPRSEIGTCRVGTRESEELPELGFAACVHKLCADKLHPSSKQGPASCKVQWRPEWAESNSRLQYTGS